jgi:hypothetical protein
VAAVTGDVEVEDGVQYWIHLAVVVIGNTQLLRVNLLPH